MFDGREAEGRALQQPPSRAFVIDLFFSRALCQSLAMDALIC